MRVCYFANWAAKRRSDISRVVPEEIDPFLCTHINFAFAKVGQNLDVKPYEEDDTASWVGGPGMYHRVNALRKNNSDLKIMLSIGGWTHASKGFNEVVRDDSSLEKFVQNVITYLRKYEFDGFDIDWEYPGATDRQAANNTKEGFTRLVMRLREEFEKEAYEKDKPRFLLSAAVGAANERIDAGYEIEIICKYFDFINVMSYDYHGAWDGKTGHNSPLYGRKNEPEKDRLWNINSSIHIWIERGCPREKLNVGISAYARSFSLFSENQTHEIGTSKAGAAEAGPYTMEPGVLAYYEVCEILNKDKQLKVYWHEEHDVPYAYRPGLWIGFDNIPSLINKVNYVKRMQLAGVIVWSLDMDDKSGAVCNQGPYPVLNTLKNELMKPESTTKRPYTTISRYPRGFWSKKYGRHSSSSTRNIYPN
ncbi:acidic mammalian chitinase-like, partial [Brachionus plicatilis]